MRDLIIRRIELDPVSCNGHTFRYSIEGGGLMQLYFGGVCNRVVTKSHFGHQSQARARAWEVDEAVDWEALKTISNRVQYHIGKRLAAGKAGSVYGSMSVLPEALRLARAGYSLKEVARAPWAYDLSPEKQPP